MLVTFQSQNAADVVMFEADARAMLKMMGRMESIPGAMYPSEVDGALARLREAISAKDGNCGASDSADSDDADAVSIGNRAFPLIHLLESAARDGKHVMWDGKQGAESAAQK